MNWEEYLPLAEKTLSRQFHCQEKEQLFLHAIIGSLTEVEELLDNYKDGNLVLSVEKQGSVGEEAADVAWYLSILFRELNLDSKETNLQTESSVKSPFNVLMEYLQINLKMLDMMKKKLYYNKEIDMVTFIEYTFKLFNLLKNYCDLYNTNFETILDKNIAKLKARYGDKFSSEKAINRDLDLEKNVLENE